MVNKKRKKRTNKKSLNGTSSTGTSKASVPGALKEGALILGSALAGGGLGAAIGKHSLIVGIPVALLGIYKKNRFITAAGIGLSLSNGFQNPITSSQAKTVNGMEDDMHGFDIDQIKDRVSTYFKNFSEKLYLPKTDTAANEVNGDDMPTRFLNPYTNSSLQGDIDLSQMDKVKAQIAQMNGMDDREF